MTSPCILLTVPAIALHIVWRERLNTSGENMRENRSICCTRSGCTSPGTIAVATGAMLGIPVIASVGGAEVVAIPDIGVRASSSPWPIHDCRCIAARNDDHNWIDLCCSSCSEHRPASQRLEVSSGSAARRCESIFPSNPTGYQQHLPSTVARCVPDSGEGPGQLLLAFKRVVNSIPGAQLTIAGEDSLGRRRLLERLCDELGLGESVNFVGPLPHAEMATLYRESDLFLLSSRHENQGMVVLEAAASGVPTVGTNVGVVPDLAPDASVAVRPQDPVALGDAVIDLLHDPARLERIGRNAVARVHHEFVAPVVRDHFLSLYLETIRNQRR